MIKISTLLLMLVLTLLLTLIVPSATLAGWAFLNHWFASFGTAVATFVLIKLVTGTTDK